MNKQTIITILLAVATITANAQTEGNDKKTLSGNDAAVGTMNFSDQMLTDTMRFNVEALQPGLLPRTTDNPRPGTELKEQYTMQGTKPFVLWQGGLLSINGATVDMPGMMGFETGVVALHQDFGRLHLTASAIANKYWMPMQGTLATQYGIGTFRSTLSATITTSIPLLALPSAPTSVPQLTVAMPTSASATTQVRTSAYAAISTPCQAVGLLNLSSRPISASARR